MTTEITKKQAIMLVVLGVILVVVLYVQLLIRPTLSAASESKEQLETLQTQYETLLQQSESYDQNLAAVEEWKEANSGETDRLYPLSRPERIDNFLNFVIHECGATITSLSVGQSMQYYIDGENNLVLISPEEAEAAGDASGAAEGEAAAASYTATGEYRMDFTYSMTGNYEDMNQLLHFVDQVSFLGVSAFSFQSVPEAESGAFVDDYTFTLTISAYMYQNPLKDLEEAEAEDGDASQEAATEEAAA